jgi:hypothetical protein
MCITRNCAAPGASGAAAQSEGVSELKRIVGVRPAS